MAPQADRREAAYELIQLPCPLNESWLFGHRRWSRLPRKLDRLTFVSGKGSLTGRLSLSRLQELAASGGRWRRHLDRTRRHCRYRLRRKQVHCVAQLSLPLRL